MPFKIDEAFGIHAQALQLYGRRAEVLAANLANADTPGYKARDIDFKSALAGAMGGSLPLSATQAGHISPAGASGASAELLYRLPLQPAADGNTVDTQTEQSQFAQNAIRYQAAFTFLDDKIKGLVRAIRGD